MRNKILFLVFLLSGLMGGILYSYEKADGFTEFIWEKNFGNPIMDNFLGCMAVSSKDQALFLAGFSLEGSNRPVASGTFWIKKLTFDEKKIEGVYDETIPSSVGLVPVYRYVEAMTVIDDDELIVLSEFELNRPVLMRLKKSGGVIFKKRINDLLETDLDVRFFNALSTKQNNVLLLGHESENALAVLINKDGKVLWKRNWNFGKTNFLLTAVPTNSGGFVLVGNSGSYSKYGLGSSSVFLLRVDSEGNQLKFASFPGRRGDICVADNRNYLLVYDKSENSNQNIYLKKLSLELKSENETHLDDVGLGFEGFRISPIGKNNFIVTGIKDFKLLVKRIDVDGKKVWNNISGNENDPDGRWFTRCDGLSSSGGGFYLGTTSSHFDRDRSLELHMPTIIKIKENDQGEAETK